MGCGQSATRRRPEAQQFHSLMDRNSDSDSEYTSPTDSETTSTSSSHGDSRQRPALSGDKNGHNCQSHQNGIGESRRAARLKKKVMKDEEDTASSGSASSAESGSSAVPSISSSKYKQLCPPPVSAPDDSLIKSSGSKHSIEAQSKVLNTSTEGEKEKRKQGKHGSKVSKKGKREKKDATVPSTEGAGMLMNGGGNEGVKPQRHRSKQKPRVSENDGRDFSHIQRWIDSRPILPPEELTPPVSPYERKLTSNATSSAGSWTIRREPVQSEPPSNSSLAEKKEAERQETEGQAVAKEAAEKESLDRKSGQASAQSGAEGHDLPDIIAAKSEGTTENLSRRDSKTSKVSAAKRRRASTLSDCADAPAAEKRRPSRSARMSQSYGGAAAFTGGSPEHGSFLRSRSKESFYTSKSSEWMYDLTNLRKEHDARQRSGRRVPSAMGELASSRERAPPAQGLHTPQQEYMLYGEVPQTPVAPGPAGAAGAPECEN